MTRWAKIRFLLATVVAATLLGGLWLVPGGATSGASVSATAAAKVSDADCETLKELSDNVPDVTGSGSSLFGKQAAAAAKGFKTTAKDIKSKKLRSAMNTMAAVYEDLADTNNVAGALTVTLRAGQKYVRALATWSKATLECFTSGVTIPTLPQNLTIPTLPNNLTVPTLPNNLTLPTLPRR